MAAIPPSEDDLRLAVVHFMHVIEVHDAILRAMKHGDDKFHLLLETESRLKEARVALAMAIPKGQWTQERGRAHYMRDRIQAMQWELNQLLLNVEELEGS